MSDQGAGDYGAASGAPATGVDGGYLGAPEQHGNGLERIYERMDDLASQQQMLVEALSQVPDEIEDDEIDWESLDDDELAEALGVTPEELAEALEEYGEADEAAPARDVFDLINESIDARMADADAERAVEQRDYDFEDLRDRLPLLQDERTARAIVEQAVQLAENYDPRLMATPQFVGLIELVAKAHIADQAIGSQRQAQAPAVQLESAAGARVETPSPTSADAWGDRIVRAAERLRPRI